MYNVVVSREICFLSPQVDVLSYFLPTHVSFMNAFLQPGKKNAYAQSGTNAFAPVERELVFDIVSFYYLTR